MKKIMKVLIGLVMVCLLTGCMKMNINVEVKADKSTDVAMEMLVEESMVQMSGMTTDDFIEQMKSEMMDSEDMKDAKTEPVTKTIDGTKWVGVKVSANSLGGDQSIKEEEIDGVKSLVLTLPMDDMQQGMDMSELETYGYSVSKLKDLGVEMNVTIKMPNKVTSNYGKVNGDTVTIDLLELMTAGKTDNIVVSSPVESGSSMTMALVGFTVVAVIAITIVVLKKKKKPAEPDEVPAPEVQPVEEVPVADDKEVAENVEEKTEE